MSSKIGLIISMLFVAIFFLFGIDLICLEFNYSDIDSKSINISYYFSKSGRIDEEFVNTLEEKYNVDIIINNDRVPEFGEEINYLLVRDYKPIVLSNDPISIRIRRSAIVGYYG